MATSGHSWGYWSPKADGTRSFLRELRGQYLKDIVPVQMNIGIDALGAIVAAGINNEAIVGVHVSVWVSKCRGRGCKVQGLATSLCRRHGSRSPGPMLDFGDSSYPGYASGGSGDEAAG